MDETKPKQQWTSGTWPRAHSAESWNAAHPVGTRVRYWPVLPPIASVPPLDTTTRSEAWELGDGTAVVKIVGKTGGVHLAHIELLETDDVKRPWDDGADYYSTSDQDERLSHERERDAVAALLDDALVNSEEAIIKANLFERHWRKALAERDEARRELADRYDAKLAVANAEAELDSARFARDRYANAIGLIESTIGFSGAIPVEETTERVRRLKVERDEARAERDEARAKLDELTRSAESTIAGLVENHEIAAKIIRARRDERDSAWARVSELETALLDACREKVVHGHTTTIWVEATRLEVPGIKELGLHADQLRSESKTLVSELVKALTDALDWAECDSKSTAAIEARKRWPDHAPTGFEARVSRLRAVLAKAKEATNGTR